MAKKKGSGGESQKQRKKKQDRKRKAENAKNDWSDSEHEEKPPVTKKLKSNNIANGTKKVCSELNVEPDVKNVKVNHSAEEAEQIQ